LLEETELGNEPNKAFRLHSHWWQRQSHQRQLAVCEPELLEKMEEPPTMVEATWKNLNARMEVQPQLKPPLLIDQCLNELSTVRVQQQVDDNVTHLQQSLSALITFKTLSQLLVATGGRITVDEATLFHDVVQQKVAHTRVFYRRIRCALQQTPTFSFVMKFFCKKNYINKAHLCLSHIACPEDRIIKEIL
jgi:hypothetical protein